MIEQHEDLVITHTMASQINDIYDSLEKNSIFQSEMAKVMQTILDNQNVIRQELFILRNVDSKSLPVVNQPENTVHISTNNTRSFQKQDVNRSLSISRKP